MRGIIDSHTHAFSDELVEKAMKILGEVWNIKVHLEGRVSSLLLNGRRTKYNYYYTLR